MAKVNSTKVSKLLFLTIGTLVLLLGFIIYNDMYVWKMKKDKDEVLKKVDEYSKLMNSKDLEIAELKGTLLAKDEKIKEYEKALVFTKSKTPNIKIIVKKVKDKVVNDETLKSESIRILGPFGLSDVRVVKSCP